MVLCSTGIARIAIYSVLQSHSQQVLKYDFWHDFAGKSVLNDRWSPTKVIFAVLFFNNNVHSSQQWQ